MNGSQASEAQKPVAAAPASPTVSSSEGPDASDSNFAAKKRKKENLKPIITTEGNPQPRSASG